MSDHGNPPQTLQPRRSWSRCFALGTVAALAFAGSGVVVATQSPSATASLGGSAPTYRLDDEPLPPPGKSWVQGIITDQANHPLDNVNVEVWPVDPAATAPVGSNLTYAGTPDDLRHQHGVFRIEVPMNEPYVIVMSAVRGAEDGDPYRMRSIGHGRPIMARSAGRAGMKLAAGRILDLGSFQIARQGRVDARTTVRLAKKKVHAGARSRLRVTVSSKYVAAPAGKVVVRVGGKKVSDRLRAADNGRTSMRLPALKRSGRYRVKAVFRATSTIHRSVSKPVWLKVR